MLRCGEQFRRRYIENEIIPPGIAAGRGTGVHKASEINLKQKVQTRQDMPLNDLYDAARDGYVNALADGVFLSKEEQSAKNKLINEGLNDCLRCTKVYHESVAPRLNPVEVEKPFNIDIGLDLNLAGRMDYQDKPLVGDLKTTTRAWPKGRARNEIQPVFYSFVHEEETGIRPEFRYDILIARRNKDGKPTSEDYQEEIVMMATDKDYKALLAKFKLFVDLLKAGVFPPCNPTDWVCSEKWCGYYSTCKYRGN